MNYYFKAPILLFFLFVFSNCEKVVDIDLSSGEKKIVVDGFISNQKGPYIVQLSRSVNYTNTFKDSKEFEENAEVIIKDDLGNLEVLKEVSPGVYSTDTFGLQGIIGRYYSLEIKTFDGQEFESNPELLKSPPLLDSVYYIPGVEIEEDGQKSDVWYCDFQEPQEKNEAYIFRYFFNHKYDGFIITKDKYFNGQLVKKFRIVGIMGGWSGEPFRMEILTVSEEAYQFWAKIGEFKDAGKPYDLPPAPLFGNVHRKGNKNDYAFGYFRFPG